MEFFLIPFFCLIAYVIIRFFSVFKKIYLLFKAQREMRQTFEEQQRSREAEQQTASPEQSSVDRIHDANMDLKGGEYIDYEEVKE